MRFTHLLILILLVVFAKELFSAPDEYRQNAQLPLGWADEFFFKNYHFAGHEKVLDIGSGDGRLTMRIAKALVQGTVLGIDNSSSMIAQSVNHYHDIPNLHFLVEDAQNSRFYQQHLHEFDLVVSFTVLNWVKDQSAVLQGIQHALKPNGKLYLKLCAKEGDPIQVIADALMKTAPYQSAFVHFKDPVRRFTPKEYELLVKQAQLQVLSIKDAKQEDKFLNSEQMAKQIKSWLPHYQYLKENFPERSQKFVDEIVDTYLKKYPTHADGSIVLYDHYLEVIGKKEG